MFLCIFKKSFLYKFYEVTKRKHFFAEFVSQLKINAKSISKFYERRDSLLKYN